MSEYQHDVTPIDCRNEEVDDPNSSIPTNNPDHNQQPDDSGTYASLPGNISMSPQGDDRSRLLIYKSWSDMNHLH